MQDLWVGEDSALGMVLASRTTSTSALLLLTLMGGMWVEIWQEQLCGDDGHLQVASRWTTSGLDSVFCTPADLKVLFLFGSPLELCECSVFVLTLGLSEKASSVNTQSFGGLHVTPGCFEEPSLRELS